MLTTASALVAFIAWTVSVKIAAENEKMVRFISTQNLADFKTPRVYRVNSPSDLTCARECAHRNDCVQFKWNNGICSMNSNECDEGLCAIRHMLRLYECTPTAAYISAKFGEEESIAEGHCYIPIFSTPYTRCYTTTLTADASQSCRDNVVQPSDIRGQCLIFQFINRVMEAQIDGYTEYFAQIYGTKFIFTDRKQRLVEEIEAADPAVLVFAKPYMPVQDSEYQAKIGNGASTWVVNMVRTPCE